MRYILSILMISLVAVLSCTPAPKDPAVKAVEEIGGDNALPGDYVPGTWIEDWDLAINSARESGRTVLVNFTGSDWCSWCIRLANEVFSQEAFEDYAKENLVLLKLDFPRKLAQSAALKKQNSDLQRQFEIQGYPTIILLNSEGREIGRTGYKPDGAEAYIDHLKEFITK